MQCTILTQNSNIRAASNVVSITSIALLVNHHVKSLSTSHSFFAQHFLAISNHFLALYAALVPDSYPNIQSMI